MGNFIPCCGTLLAAIVKVHINRHASLGINIAAPEFDPAQIKLRVNFAGGVAATRFLPRQTLTLTTSLINPTSTSAGVYGGQVLALKISVGLNDVGGTTPPTPVGLGGGALPAEYSFSGLNALADLFNLSFDNCVNDASKTQYLSKTPCN